MTDNLDRLVQRHRDEASPTLQYDWPLLRLLDRSGSQTLMDDLREDAQSWEIREATKDLWQILPDSPGLYMFVWRPWFRFEVAEQLDGRASRPDSVSQILYIGQAGATGRNQSSATLKQRYRSYAKRVAGDPRDLWIPALAMTRQELGRYLAMRPLEYWFTVIEDREKIKAFESRLLQMFNPPLNKNELPKIRSRFLPPEPAFGGAK